MDFAIPNSFQERNKIWLGHWFEILTIHLHAVYSPFTRQYEYLQSILNSIQNNITLFSTILINLFSKRRTPNSLWVWDRALFSATLFSRTVFLLISRTKVMVPFMKFFLSFPTFISSIVVQVFCWVITSNLELWGTFCWTRSKSNNLSLLLWLFFLGRGFICKYLFIDMFDEVWY